MREGFPGRRRSKSRRNGVGNGGGAPYEEVPTTALFSMLAAFFDCWIFSVTDHSASAVAEQQAFEAQFVRSQTEIGAEGAAAH